MALRVDMRGFHPLLCPLRFLGQGQLPRRPPHSDFETHSGQSSLRFISALEGRVLRVQFTALDRSTLLTTTNIPGGPPSVCRRSAIKPSTCSSSRFRQSPCVAAFSLVETSIRISPTKPRTQVLTCCTKQNSAADADDFLAALQGLDLVRSTPFHSSIRLMHTNGVSRDHRLTSG